ncbi:hypothetical protein [Xanthomonas oryzae]|uniref:hypothetical protein n=1 Tax=Xanthomonas oryzae TaxID=347 RepID=UPI0013EFBCA2|nr:hypothetical protein [Xanthomonas oryzae]
MTGPNDDVYPFEIATAIALNDSTAICCNVHVNQWQEGVNNGADNQRSNYPTEKVAR